MTSSEQHRVQLMNGTPKHGSRWARQVFVLGRGIVLIALVGFAVAWTLNRVETGFEERRAPAGFARGLLQGALMPIAMPNLIFGNDVAIYATNNTGRSYKLGYTMGVNACGLVFFGFSFWRIRWLRRAASLAQKREEDGEPFESG
jgi:hypothetical protein